MAQYISYSARSLTPGTGNINDINGQVGPSVSIAAGTGINVITTTNTVTIENTAPSPTGTINTFAGFSNSGALESISSFTRNSFNGLDTTFSLDSVGGGQVYTWNQSYTPTANSTDSWLVHNVNTLIDMSGGWNWSPAGTALTNINQGITITGSGGLGGLNFNSANVQVGNGTDPAAVGGVNYYLAFSNIQNNATVSNYLQGYGFQPTFQTGSTVGSGAYLNAFYDSSQINVPSYFHTSFSSSPSLFEINNNYNYAAFISNPNITTLDGNAGVFGYGFYPTVTTSGATSNIVAFNANPTITTMGATSSYNGVSIGGVIATAHGSVSGTSIFPTITSGDADFTGLNISPTGTTTGNSNGVNIQLANLTSGEVQGPTGLSSDSKLNINGTTNLVSAQTFQIGTRVDHLFTVPSGSPVTNTDSLGLDLAGDLWAQDSVANGITAGLVGWTGVGFISSIIVSSGKTVDTANIFGAFASLPTPPSGTDGGTVTNLSMIKTAPPLAQGGVLNVTNMKAVNISGDFNSAATNAWGLYVEHANTKNHIQGNLDLGSLTMNGSTSGALTHQAAATTTSYSVTWPSAQGSASTVLTNDGSGNLSWAAGGGGSSFAMKATIEGGADYSAGADSVIIYDTDSGANAYDPNNIYNPTTGYVTAPATGVAKITATIHASGGSTIYVAVDSGGGPVNVGYLVAVTAAVTVFNGATEIHVNSGDLIGIFTDTAANYTDSGGGAPLNSFTFSM